MFGWQIVAGALMVSASVSALGAPAAGPNPAFTGSDLFSLAAASDPKISPDGRQIAYVRRSSDIMTDKLRSAIWLVDVASGEQRPIAAGSGDSFGPAWSPDGKRLAYGSSAEGGAPQLFVRWMDGGQSVRITGLPDSPQAIEWSPDGTRIAYLMAVPDEGPKLGSAPPKPEGAEWAKPLEIIDKVTYRVDGPGYLKPGYDHIFIVDALGGAPRQLTFGAVHDGPPHWSRDGGSILFSAIRKPNWEMEANDSEVYRVSLAGGEPRALTSRKGPDADPRPSPDGRSIAFVGFDDRMKGYEQALLYVMDSNGGGARQVAPGLDRSIDDFAWSADGRSIVASYQDAGRVTVSRISLDGRVTPINRNIGGGGLDRPYAGGAFSVARGGTIAFTSDSPTRPAELMVTSGGAARQLTRLNDLSLSGKNLGTLREISVTAPDGGKVPS